MKSIFCWLLSISGLLNAMDFNDTKTINAAEQAEQASQVATADTDPNMLLGLLQDAVSNLFTTSNLDLKEILEARCRELSELLETIKVDEKNGTQQ